jgi:hypothetical protein
MSNANKLFFAFALAVSAAAFVSQATAQQAQQSARDAAIHNQAHREFPGGEDQDIPRSEAYKACMASAGFQP